MCDGCVLCTLSVYQYTYINYITSTVVKYFSVGCNNKCFNVIFYNTSKKNKDNSLM